MVLRGPCRFKLGKCASFQCFQCFQYRSYGNLQRFQALKQKTKTFSNVHVSHSRGHCGSGSEVWRRTFCAGQFYEEVQEVLGGWGSEPNLLGEFKHAGPFLVRFESNCAWSGEFVLSFRKDFLHSWEFPMSHTGFCHESLA